MKRAQLYIFGRSLLLTLLVLLLSVSLLFSGCFPVRFSTYHSYGMGTSLAVTVEDRDLASFLFTVVTETESCISHRIAASQIASLNAGETVSVDASLSEALSLALEIEEKTEGKFSVLCLPLTRLWDFNAVSPVPPSVDEIALALAEMKNAGIKMENDAFSLTGGALDLGAIGKGYAADQLARYMREAGAAGLISVGGSIAAVGEKNGEAWRVGVRDPFASSPNQTLGTLFLTELCVSTSGSYEKQFVYQENTYHHILDATTGYPVMTDLVSVTVVAESGLLTDILSTACFILGFEEGLLLCREYGAEALFVTSDGTLYASAGLSSLFSPIGGREVIYR